MRPALTFAGRHFLLILFFTLLSIVELDILLLNELLELLYLITIKFDTHIMCGCDQIRCDLHLLHAKRILIIILIVLITIFAMAEALILAVTTAFLLAMLVINIIFFVVDARVLLFAIFLTRSHHSLPL